MREIKLLKNNDERTDTDLEWIQEFYSFLQGDCPNVLRFRKGRLPKLSQKKAFSVIWCLQEHFPILPDSIEQCSVCGRLYNSNSEGLHWETKGKFYCGNCQDIVPQNYDRGKK